MSLFRALALFTLALTSLSAADGAGSVLKRMDQEAATFRQMTARLSKATHTAVLNDTTTEVGAMWMRRNGKNVQVRTEIEQPEQRAFGLDGTTGQVFYPKMNMVQIYDLGKSRSLVDQFLLLGFGSPGKELAKHYSIQVTGEETVAGQKTTKVELVPKAPKVLEQIKKVELWIPLDAGHPIQQKFHQPGGDYYLVAYSDVKVNPSLPDDMFRLKLPPNVKREFPQK